MTQKILVLPQKRSKTEFFDPMLILGQKTKKHVFFWNFVIFWKFLKSKRVCRKKERPMFIRTVGYVKKVNNDFLQYILQKKWKFHTFRSVLKIVISFFGFRTQKVIVVNFFGVLSKNFTSLFARTRFWQCSNRTNKQKKWPF